MKLEKEIIKPLFRVIAIFLAGLFIGAGLSGAVFIGELKRSNTALGDYKRRHTDAVVKLTDAKKRNSELEKQLDGVTSGLNDIGIALSGNVQSLRSAIIIISKVRDRLQELEDSGVMGNTGGAGSRDN